MNDRAAAQAAYRVLVVDDDPDMVGFLALMLQREGMSVETAGDGQSALMKVMTSPPASALRSVSSSLARFFMNVGTRSSRSLATVTMMGSLMKRL